MALTLSFSCNKTSWGYHSLGMKETVSPRCKMKVAKNDVIAIANLAKADKAKGNDIINGSIGVFLNEDGSLGKIKTIDDALKKHICDRLGYPASIGDKEYLDAVERWVFEDNYSRIHELYHVFTGASIGGTGAISNAFNLFLDEEETVLLPSIMWNNYKLLAKKAKAKRELYDLFDENGRFNIASLKEHIESCLKRDGKAFVVINDPCENPTGYCLSEKEYDELFALLSLEGQKGKLIVLFDIAYLSYYAVEGKKCKLIDKLVESKVNFLPLIAFSCSKVFGLYGMRMGALLALASSEQERADISSAYGTHARGTYSCPVGAGGYAVALAMNDPSLKNELLSEIEANKIALRERGEILLNELDKAGIKHYPYHSGFFLTIKVERDAEEIFEELKAEHIYIVPIGMHEMRIALSGLSKKECVTLVKEIQKVL